jgi:tetratricopeptide (TPR) repeat protein
MTTAGQTPGEPAELDALVALADREQNAGRLAEAAAAYRKIVLLRPDIAEAYNNLGNVLVGQGRLDEAAAQFERAAALNPDLFQAHNNLGNVLRVQGKLDRAMAQYKQAIALRPNLAEAYNNLGSVLLDLCQFDAAAAQLERAVKLKPDLYQAYNSLGCLCQDQGKFDQALAHYSRALAINPHYPEAHNNRGDALKQLGRLDEAAACYDQALTLRPDYAEAHHGRAELKTFRAGDADLAALESLAADSGQLPPGKMLYVHFALGKALEDVGDYGRAFEHLLKANALRRREIDYNQAACQRSFRLIAEMFDAELLSRFQGVGDPSPAPIFIVGMPRSGSTLVEQILASHPQVHAAGELANLDLLVRGVTAADGRPIPFPQCISALDADGLRRMGEAYLASLPPLAEGKIRITDKAPGNFLRAGMIRLILPNARIIHTMRDPVDTCVSCFSRIFKTVSYSYDLAELGCYYRWYHELMEHWRSVLPPGAMLDVVYEDVVDNLEEQARRLIDYCGLPWDDRCLSFHETSRPIQTASSVQVRKPLYRSSLERWRRYETFLQPLLAELESCRQTE